jgi:hypothetical protein
LSKKKCNFALFFKNKINKKKLKKVSKDQISGTFEYRIAMQF